jgi:hypothetical protein
MLVDPDGKEATQPNKPAVPSPPTKPHPFLPGQPRYGDEQVKKGFPPGPGDADVKPYVPVFVIYDGEDDSGKCWPKSIFYADGQSFGKYAKYYPHISAQPKDLDDLERLVEALEAYVKKHGKIIDLRIYDHGNENNQEIGDIWLQWVLSSERGRELLKRLGNTIAKNGGLGLYGCKTGKYPEEETKKDEADKQRNLLEELARLMPHVWAVRASRKNVWYIGSPPDPNAHFDSVARPEKPADKNPFSKPPGER